MIDGPVDTTFPLSSGWALKSNQKLGKRGAGKRITQKVRRYLEGFFLAGNVDKTNRMTATEMVKELEILVAENEITAEEVPSIKRVDNWIAAYAAGLRREAAADRDGNFGEGSSLQNSWEQREVNVQITEDQRDNNNRTIQGSESKGTSRTYSGNAGHDRGYQPNENQRKRQKKG